jgi:hypothetical protein
MYGTKKKMGHGGKARKEMMGGGMYKKKQMKKGGKALYNAGGVVSAMEVQKPN